MSFGPGWAGMRPPPVRPERYQDAISILICYYVYSIHHIAQDRATSDRHQEDHLIVSIADKSNNQRHQRVIVNIESTSIITYRSSFLWVYVDGVHRHIVDRSIKKLSINNATNNHHRQWAIVITSNIKHRRSSILHDNQPDIAWFVFCLLMIIYRIQRIADDCYPLLNKSIFNNS